MDLYTFCNVDRRGRSPSEGGAVAVVPVRDVGQLDPGYYGPEAQVRDHYRTEEEAIRVAQSRSYALVNLSQGEAVRASLGF